MNQYGLRSFTVDTALRDAARTASTLWCVLENPRLRISGRLGASGGRGLSAGAVSGVYTLSASPRLSHHRRAYALDPERRTSTRIRSVQNPSSSRQGISAQFAGDLRGPLPLHHLIVVEDSRTRGFDQPTTPPTASACGTAAQSLAG